MATAPVRTYDALRFVGGRGLRTRIKICGITREQDAMSATQLGADAIGFIFWRPSARYIDPKRAGSIAAELPAFVTSVCVFVNPTLDEVAAALDRVPAGTLQFHGEEPAEFCTRFGRPYIKSVRMKPGIDLVEYFAPYAGATAWLIDAFDERTYGGTGTSFDWNLLPGGLARPWILSGGLTVNNVTEAARRLRPWAVDVSSGVESAKGIKDATKIAAFISGVRNADG
ncbi:MAG: N-(5'-phosphoribosyl)anthranilate isomerase [Betaproteobacteria bacterium RIFCSPLOWO2_02_FULL_63_19]|nr:MAG: N-(5'-phosphoribosyl)anthranilate isomerase [Betaproteobacteria bacterium RIFCSPLOWO2_02_FULL_63_19]